MKERNQSLDVLRGLGIFFMVFDHVGWGDIIHTYIQSFHMPLFFIVSGYLWKNENTLSIVKKRFKALMIPYTFFAVLYLCLQIHPAFNNKNNFMNSLRAVLLYPTDIANMPIAPALWFLPCMFFASITYSLLSRFDFKVKMCAIIAITVTGMLFSSWSDIMLPFTIEPVMVAMGFMIMGEIICKYQDKVMNILDKKWIIVLLLILEAVLAFVNGSVDMRSARYQNCILYIINSFIGTMAYWGIARKICAMKTKKTCFWVQKLSFLSVNAMGYICLNQFCIMVIDKAVQKVIPIETVVLIAAKQVAIFIITMLFISLVTRMIKGSQFNMILGGK